MKTALVTGSNTGVGFDASRQLLQTGEYSVVMGCRSAERAEAARVTLEGFRTKPDEQTVTIVLFDNNDPAVIAAAVASLKDAGTQLDVVISNAGAMSRDVAITQGPTQFDSGVVWFSAGHNIGHYSLIAGLINAEVTADDAALIFVASESVRVAYDADELATKTGKTREQIMKMVETGQLWKEPGMSWSMEPDYGFHKLMMVLVMGALQRREKGNRKFFAVSPGGTFGTSVGNDPSRGTSDFAMRTLFKVMYAIGQFHSLETGAKRYFDLATRPQDFAGGRFWASPKRRFSMSVTGPLTDWTDYRRELGDPEFQDAALRVNGELTGIHISPA